MRRYHLRSEIPGAVRTLLELVIRFCRLFLGRSVNGFSRRQRNVRQSFEPLLGSVEDLPLLGGHLLADLDVALERLERELPAARRTRMKLPVVGKGVG